jgi:hypothetical protein
VFDAILIPLALKERDILPASIVIAQWRLNELIIDIRLRFSLMIAGRWERIAPQFQTE